MLCNQENRLSFQALLECQRFRGWIWPGIWNSAVWRERKNTQMGEKRNQDALTLRKCKGGEETGTEERNRRVSFYSKGAVLTAEDQRNWLHRMEKLIQDQWEKPAAAARAILGHWPKLTEVSRVVNFSLELHPALLPLHLNLCSSCTGEDEGSLLLAYFVKSGVTLSLPWRNKLKPTAPARLEVGKCLIKQLDICGAAHTRDRTADLQCSISRMELITKNTCGKGIRRVTRILELNSLW